MSSRVAIVTGANKGIGFAVTQGLCQKFNGDVYLTARDEARGQAAVKELQNEGLNPVFHQLDIADPISIRRLRDHIQNKYGGVDLLINNAAIMFGYDNLVPFPVQARETTLVNYFAFASVCNILFPILKQNARVVNVSSSSGHLFKIPSEALRKRFAARDITEDAISDLVKEFVASAEKGTNIDDGWGGSAYNVSKVALSCLSNLQSRQLAARGVAVNSVHPGYVDTDMTSHRGPLTIQQGAEPILYLALDAPQDLTGAYVWKDKRVIEWDKPMAEVV